MPLQPCSLAWGGIGPAFAAAFNVIAIAAVAQIVYEIGKRVWAVAEAYQGLTAKIKEAHQAQLDLNWAAFLNFHDLDTGHSRINEVNAEIKALEDEKTRLQQVRDSWHLLNGITFESLRAAHALIGVTDKLTVAEGHRAELMKQFQTVQKDVNQWAAVDANDHKKALEDAAKTADHAAKEEQKAYEQLYAAIHNASDTFFSDQQKQQEDYKARVAQMLADDKAQSDERVKQWQREQQEKTKLFNIEQAATKAHDDALKALAASHIDWLEKENLISFSQAEKMRKDSLDREYADESAATKAKLKLMEQEFVQREHIRVLLGIDSEADAAAKIKSMEAENIEYQKLLKALQAIDDKFHKTKQSLDEAAADRKIALYKNVFNSLNSTMRSELQGVLQGTETTKQALEKLFQHSLLTEAEYLAEAMAKRAEQMVLNLVLHGTIKQAEVAQTAAAAAEEKSIGFMAALKEVTHAAVKAAAHTYASISAIPIIGPALAPEAAALAFVAVEGLGAMASASGGWGQVPRDTMAMIHKDEMVLPARIAEGVRKMSEGNSGSGSSSSATFNINPTATAVDSAGIAKVLRDHSNTIIKEVTRQIRLGKIK